jgi:hypothetical protein
MKMAVKRILARNMPSPAAKISPTAGTQQKMQRLLLFCKVDYATFQWFHVLYTGTFQSTPIYPDNQLNSCSFHPSSFLQRPPELQCVRLSCFIAGKASSGTVIPTMFNTKSRIDISVFLSRRKDSPHMSGKTITFTTPIVGCCQIKYGEIYSCISSVR